MKKWRVWYFHSNFKIYDFFFECTNGQVGITSDSETSKAFSLDLRQ